MTYFSGEHFKSLETLLLWAAVWFKWILLMHSTMSWSSAAWTTEAAALTVVPGANIRLFGLLFITFLGDILHTVPFHFFWHYFPCTEGCEGLEPIPTLLDWRWSRALERSSGQSRQTDKWSHQRMTWSWHLTCLSVESLKLGIWTDPHKCDFPNCSHTRSPNPIFVQAISY